MFTFKELVASLVLSTFIAASVSAATIPASAAPAAMDHSDHSHHPRAGETGLPPGIPPQPIVIPAAADNADHRIPRHISILPVSQHGQKKRTDNVIVVPENAGGVNRPAPGDYEEASVADTADGDKKALRRRGWYPYEDYYYGGYPYAGGYYGGGYPYYGGGYYRGGGLDLELGLGLHI